MQEKVSSLDEFCALAQRFARSLTPRKDTATVVALSGELGAGKTTFVQTLAKVLGIEETVTSPTFIIEKIYALEGQRYERLVHIDAFRLKGERHLELLGWKELVADSRTLIVVEWPEQVPALIPTHALRVRIDIQGHRRIISIDGKENAEEESSEDE